MKAVLRTLITADVKCPGTIRPTRSGESSRELVTIVLMRDGDPSSWGWSVGAVPEGLLWEGHLWQWFLSCLHIRATGKLFKSRDSD